MAKKRQKSPKPPKTEKPQKAKKNSKPKSKGRCTRDEKTGLTKRQEAFARHYAIHGSPSQAYRHAYSVANMTPKAITANSKKLLRDTRLRLLVDELQQSQRDTVKARFDIDAESNLQAILGMINFDVTEYANWGVEDVVKTNREGESYTKSEEFVRLTPSAELSAEQRSRICGFDRTADKAGNVRLSLKLPDKLAARLQLHKLLGYGAPEKVDVKHSADDAAIRKIIQDLYHEDD